MYKEKNGITLIALVITVIVLLILASVSIAMLTGENGILNQAKKAKEETEEARKNEENIIENYEGYLNSYSGENTEFIDSLGNKVKVPEGFRVVNPENNVEDGIVIEDVVHEETKGSQFVWIPVGSIKTEKGEVNIELNRYTFDEDGKEVKHDNSKIKDTIMGVGFEELQNSNFGNIVAKNIEEFKMSVSKNKGYYIGRYEARTSEERTEKTEDELLTKISTKSDEYIYNFVSQRQAANLSRNMYGNDESFVSDLINSYAWDTAIVFIQKCSENVKYSKQTTINTVLANKGTNSLQIQDKVCNIFDMASNCMEWTTETCDCSGSNYVNRGDFFDRGNREDLIQELFKTDFRNSSSDKATVNSSFRPILYLR